MTIAFVHGNPETAEIWTDLLAALGRADAVTLSPPGFGAPVPDGFSATSDAYAHWLIGELEQLGGPVDLVGHDWGGGHVARVVAMRPDLVNRWCIDIAGCFNDEYVWHDAALGWQQPEVGEQMIAGMAAVPIEQRVAGFASLGMSPAAARSAAEAAATPEMGRCILALYRSAAQPKMAEWGREIPPSASSGKSLVLIATEDHYTGGEPLARKAAERWGSEVALLPGLGHWWMCQDPAKGAEVLSGFFR